jgi:predicted trehalose synthase
VENQGDAWTVTSACLDRFVEEQRLLTAEAAGHSDEQAAYLRRMEQVGRRVAEFSSRLEAVMTSSISLPNRLPQTMCAAGRTASCSVPAERLMIWYVADRT